MGSVRIKNVQRRNFLKYSLLVGGGFLVGKFFDSVLGLFPSKEKPGLKDLEPAFPHREKATLFENFVVKETEKEMRFHDRGDGYEIFVIEK